MRSNDDQYGRAIARLISALRGRRSVRCPAKDVRILEMSEEFNATMSTK
jgi:hypothetical protein